MTRIQLLKVTDYWTQRKDTDAPSVECQVTSGANYLMALGLYEDLMPRCPLIPASESDAARAEREAREGTVPTVRQRLPDWINDVAESPEGRQTAAIDGWTGDPREDHNVLAWAINQVANKKVNVFRWDLTLEAIFQEIAHGRPVILSGVFGQYKSVKDGLMHNRDHVVCLTGMETGQEDVAIAPAVDLAQISAALIADPYGDFHTDYQNQQGAECRFALAELQHILKDQDAPTKWAHVYATGGSI